MKYSIDIPKKNKLHWFHWVVISLSIILTFSAWYISTEQVNSKAKLKFSREVNHVVELISERMNKYEDALWAGVSLINMRQGTITYQEWLDYANSLKLNTKYPGINGIGVIHYLKPEQLNKYLSENQKTRSYFKIFPKHNKSIFLPITFVEPYEINKNAIGLDMAHEENRYTAAIKARETQRAQITGPITLVQDKNKTPGFLFYAPFYKQKTSAKNKINTKTDFLGLVYAPFIVEKLMLGALEKGKRHVGIRISDNNQIIYDEHNTKEPDHDPDAIYTATKKITMYGRVWNVDIRSTYSFKNIVKNNQPFIILIGAIIIDILLVTLFIMLASSRKQVIEELKRNNEELDNFAYIASHDLKEPIRGIHNYSEFLLEDYHGILDEEGIKKLKTLTKLTNKMTGLLDDLLYYSRIGQKEISYTKTDTFEVVSNIKTTLQPILEEKNIKVIINNNLPVVYSEPVLIQQLFSNLIINATKYNDKDNKAIEVGIISQNNKNPIFYIKDNGIGIEKRYHDIIFKIFKRLHKDKYGTGTGSGLTISQKIVKQFGGDLWLESTPNEGTTFFFTITQEASNEFRKSKVK